VALGAVAHGCNFCFCRWENGGNNISHDFFFFFRFFCASPYSSILDQFLIFCLLLDISKSSSSFKVSSGVAEIPHLSIIYSLPEKKKIPIEALKF